MTKSVKIKILGTGRCCLANPGAPAGFDGPSAILEISDVPEDVAPRTVLWQFDRVHIWPPLVTRVLHPAKPIPWPLIADKPKHALVRTDV